MSTRRVVIPCAICITGLLAVLAQSLFSRNVTAAPSASTHRSHSTLPSNQTGLSLPLLVDGSRNPEAVPVSLAYRHFVKAVATDGSPTGIARQNAQLARIGKLSSADRTALLAVLSAAQPELARIETMRRGGSVHVAVAPELNTQEHALVDQVAAQIRSSLSPDAAASVDRYVREHVRRRIMVYGDRVE
jgi:hypothetical protein